MAAPRRPALVWLVRIMNVLAIIAAMLLFAGSITLMSLGNNLKIADYVVLVYVLFFTIGAVIVELGLTQPVRDSLFSKSWLLRGAFYTFIGTIVLDIDALKLQKAWAKFVEATGWIFIVVGVLFFAMGALCVDRLYRKQLDNYDASAKVAAVLRNNPASAA